jgi:Na+/phosphate symporter
MSKLLLDIVRDLKRVNAHLAAAAYPILEGRAANCCRAG